MPQPTLPQETSKGKKILWTGVGLVVIGAIVNFVPLAKPEWAKVAPGSGIFLVIQITLFVVALIAIVPVFSYGGSNYSGEIESIKIGRVELKIRPRPTSIESEEADG